MKARWWFTAPIALALLGGAGWVGLVRAYHRAGPLEVPRAVIVAPGGLGETATTLARAGAIRGRRDFEIAAAFTWRDGPIHAGEFMLPAHASLAQILAVLRFGVPVQHKVTIPEGLTAAQVSRLIAMADGLAGPFAVPDEGSVLPQTYAFLRGALAADLIARAQEAMRRSVATAWQGRNFGLGLTSPVEAVIVASLVEKETAIPGERPRIAAVFLNRLRDHMKLQSDPTVVYAASGGLGSTARPISRSDLEMDGPYNTYGISGLPAGPICNPGSASIQAVLHPARDASLYFVADGSGGHLFAETLPQHLRNVAQYREKETGPPRGGPAPVIR